MAPEEDTMPKAGWLAAGLLAGIAAHARTETVTYDGQKAGEAPRGFSCALTGRGRAGTWKVQGEAGAPSGPNVLAQSDADATSYRFPHCVLDGFSATDVVLSVRFKTIGGQEDQAAGLIFRYRDRDNYYVVRANALEGNVVLYKVENGKRSDLDPTGMASSAYGKKANVPRGRWGSLGVSVRGARFEVLLADEKLFEVEDRTFAGPGKVGVWTKADSVTLFDDLRAEAR
jgi:hypothetical protein